MQDVGSVVFLATLDTSPQHSETTKTTDFLQQQRLIWWHQGQAICHKLQFTQVFVVQNRHPDVNQGHIGLDQGTFHPSNTHGRSSRQLT